MKTFKIFLFIFILFIGGINIVNAGSGSGSVVVTVTAVPTVTTSTSASITQTGATLGANVTSLGLPASISARGTCWGTTVNPTSNCAAQGATTTGVFTHARTGLSCGTTYHYRGYATNTTGTGYSPDATFTTSACSSVPTVTTPTSASIAQTTVTLGANVTSLGVPASISARGTCWGTSTNPTTNCTAQGTTTTGVFTQARTGLSCGTTYYYRGYATNTTGTGYSTSGTFTTSACSYTVTGTAGSNGTISPSSRSVNSGATTTFTVTPNSGYTASASGCSGSLSGTTYTTGAITANCTVTASFTASSCTGTPWGTMASGTSKTAYLSATPAGACTSQTRTCTNGTLSGTYTATSCTPGCTGTPWGSVVNGYSNTAYSTSSVTYPSSCTSQTRTCSSGVMSGSYTYTSCSVNPVAPTVTTSSVSSIAQNSAVSGGTIVSNGGATVTVSGIAWSTSSNPTTANSKTTNGWATGGPWSSTMSGLSCGTTYHVRAYATNSKGTSYGSDVAFTSSSCPVNGVCSATHYSCSAGTSTNNVSGSTTWTWSCAGSSGGTTASCSENKPSMTGVITSSPSSCTIAAGASSCNVTITWSTTNPIGTSAVTASGMTNVNGNSGSQSMAVPYNNRTFYLYNNGTELDYVSVPSGCGTNYHWGGSSCVLDTHTVTGTAGSGGTISPASSTVNYGSTTTLTVTPNTGYTASASGCSGSLSGTTYTTGAINTDCTVTATFTLKTYTVTGTAGSGGTISPASRTVNHGSTTTFTVTPNLGYAAAASGCSGSLSGTTYTTGSITGACTVSATFTATGCVNGATNFPTCTICASGYAMSGGVCTLVTVSVTASPTTYNTVPSTNVPFAYTSSTNIGTTECRLLDNASGALTSYATTNPIQYAPPVTPGSYGYYVQCRNATTTTATDTSNLITVNVIAVSVTASPTTYNVAPSSNISFTYTPTANVGGTECRLLDNTSTALTSYQASSPIVRAAPATVGAYGYYVQCRSTSATTATATSTLITANVSITNVAPTLSASTVSSITTTGATLGGTVDSLGVPASISARGTCWGTTSNPTTNCVAQGGTTTGAFTQARTGLTPGTLYHYRAYATNTTGTGYSPDATFTTNTAVASLPTVTTTSPVTNIADTTAIGGGTIVSDGGATVTVSGLVWDTSANPTIANSKTTDGWATGGPWSSTMTGLTPDTTYHVRAYATNSVGTSYGADVIFTTTLTGTISASGCTIPEGQSNCNTLISWDANNFATDSIVKTGSTTITSGKTGTDYPYSIPAGIKNFDLWNNGVVIASTSATAVCANTTHWDSTSSTCVLDNPTNLFTSTPSTIFKGKSAVLTWNSPLSISCIGIGFNTSGAVSNLSPGVTVSPLVTTTYTLRCTNGTATTDSTVTTKVITLEIKEN